MTATKGKVNMQKNLKWRSNENRVKQEDKDNKGHSLHRDSCEELHIPFLVGIAHRTSSKTKKRQLQDLLQKSKSCFFNTLHLRAYYYLKSKQTNQANNKNLPIMCVV